jgi:hypothetical protein
MHRQLVISISTNSNSGPDTSVFWAPALDRASLYSHMKKHYTQKRSCFIASIIGIVLLVGELAAQAANPPSSPMTNDSKTAAIFRFDQASSLLDPESGMLGIKESPRASFDADGRFGGSLRITASPEGSCEPGPVLTILEPGTTRSIFSVQLWVRFQGAQEGASPVIAKDMYIFSSQAAFLRYAVDRYAIEFCVNRPDGSWEGVSTRKQDFTPVAGEWYFVTAEYDGAEIRLAVDEHLQAKELLNGTFPAELELGGVAWNHESSELDFNGWIDDLRVSEVPRLNIPPATNSR